MNYLIYGSLMWAVAFIATPHSEGFNKDYYPHCTPIADEVQRAWHNSEIREDVARRIIQRCLAAEDRGVFED